MKQQCLRKFACLNFLSCIILAVCTQAAFAADTFTLSGYVRDEQTQETLPGVHILVNQGKWGTTTNAQGFYQLQLPAGQYELTFSFISYQPVIQNLHLSHNQQLHIMLTQAYITTEEVVIHGRKAQEDTEHHTDILTLDAQEISRMPFLLGEADPLKAIQLLPGVQTSGEGNTGFHVRGGAADQNLVLLDDAPIYNAAHVFGFFSVFNGSAIDQVELMKGGIPAAYGGRLSSVMHITSRSGNKENWKAEAGLGLIAGNLQVEGPLLRQKSSLYLAGRRTHYDLLNKAFLQNTSSSSLNTAFHDLNFKADYLFSDRDKLELSAYTGKDYFQYEGNSSFQNYMSWGNQAASLQWKHVFSPKLFSRTSLFHSRYQMNFNATMSSYRFHITSGVADYGAKQLLIYTPSQQQEISTGVEVVRHTFSPNDIEAFSGETLLDFGQAQQLHALEGALFLNDVFTPHPRWKVNAGARLSFYQHLGPYRHLATDNSLIATDTLYYKKNEAAAQYLHLEPRASLTYQASSTASLKLSYDKIFQYTHMAPMSSTSLPTDVWVPSTRRIKPQYSRQYALGVSNSFADRQYEGSLMVYYKQMHNQIEYRDGALLSYHTQTGLNFDDNFYFGKGKSYGTELYIRKHRGFVNGWIAYTLSRTLRQFEDLNEGKPFPAKYDRLHDLSVVANYRPNPKWTFSAVAVFSSGNALTLPVARYVINGNIISEYEGRNNFRMPPYHRMDISATYYPTGRGRIKPCWVFSIYNIYNRLNPYYLYFDVQGDISEYYLEVKARQVSLFPVLPSVTYKITFE